MTQARILINGLERSGTSWLQKTFDQHPEVFASHEPDLEMVWDRDYPVTDPDLAVPYVDSLFASRGLRSMRKRPLMPKAYRGQAAYMARNTLMMALSLPEKVMPGLARTMARVPVPDLADLSTATRVVKTVTLQNAIPVLAARNPDLKIIYIVRHPCGFVQSMLTGVDQGKMPELFLPPREDMGRMYPFDCSLEALTEADLPHLEILAYRWSVLNDFVGPGRADLPNVTVVSYEDLCADPLAAFQALFEAVGLSWDRACASFLEASLSADQDADSYHGLIRSPSVAANRWRTKMAPGDIETVKRICRVSGAAALFPDLAE